jgi:hypothetical protein
MMLFQAILGKRSAWLLPFVAYCIVLAGCIAEPPTPPQVVPEVIVPPASITFSAPISGYKAHTSPPTGTMFVHWNQSVADTQLNFKGYLLKLYHADTTGYYITQNYNVDSTVMDSVTIFRPYTAPGVPVKFTDTSYTFTSLIGASANSGIPLGTYAVFVYGLKTGTPSASITPDSAFYVGLFDPLPLESPTNLRATSVGPTSVLLRWTAPVTDKDTGLFQYVVYYRDTSLSPFDTGHIAAIIPIPHPNIGNDSLVLVSVPGHNASGSTTSEWPYEFWVKAERNDSTFFYGSDMYGPDTNHVIWAGAAACPQNGNDTIYPGYLLVPNDSIIYFGPNNGAYDMVLNETPGTGQVSVSISNNIVTLSIVSPNGDGFLAESPNNPRIDPAAGLDSIFYTTPLANASQFNLTSIQLTTPTTDSGVVVYLMMNDPLLSQPEWARIFIRAQQPGGSFINTNALGGGVDLKASFQPGVSTDGQYHLPFY